MTAVAAAAVATVAAGVVAEPLIHVASRAPVVAG